MLIIVLILSSYMNGSEEGISQKHECLELDLQENKTLLSSGQPLVRCTLEGEVLGSGSSWAYYKPPLKHPE